MRTRLSLRGAPRRAAVALLFAHCLFAVCGAAEPIAPAGTRRPAPSRDAAAMPWPAPGPRQTAPNFEAPSAGNCMRPVQAVEVPGWAPGQSAGTPGDAMRDAARAGDAPASEAALAAAPLVKRAAPAFAPEPPRPAPRQRQEAEQVTAGMVDDNADFSAYLQFLRKHVEVPHRARDVRERYLLQVRTPAGEAVPDAEVAVRGAGGAAMWARTDSAGRAWLHPRAFDPHGDARYRLAVRKDGRQAEGVLELGQKSAVEVVLDAAPQPARARLDLLFLVDATGSMDDEIAKLRASLGSIAGEVARLPSRPDLCLGLVAYRDRGDAFLLRRYDLSNDLVGFQAALDALRADGGGDYPEAMNEAFHEAVHGIDWRGSGTTRLVVLLADAPPHLDYGGPQYDQDMLAALGKGIKVFPVGASGLNRQGEYVQRQIAQYTGGRFVFLTYEDAADPASGPGRETVHDVRNYSIQSLDRLIVRLVSDELEQLPRGGKG
ncbi:vWA domain-containing protein [Variovorax sp.]|uniref:vWA domain-containing protein n=1 Tax=Variovorax sp. TaxID=1871043 RepID=UPI002D672A3C|nr:VWA domain-containing protein [Variovorax sp.]HYP83317.1 VWA domain-containing protein [Variovorax sp.]